MTHELTNQSIAELAPYAGTYNTVVVENARALGANDDPVCAGIADRVYNINTGEAAQDVVRQVATTITDEALFAAEGDAAWDRLLTGNYRGVDATARHHRDVTTYLGGRNMIASTANSRVIHTVTQAVRDLQPTEVVPNPQQPSWDTSVNERPLVADGTHTAYQVTTLNLGHQAGWVTALIRRPVTIANGNVVEQPAASTDEQLQNVHAQIVGAWHDSGYGEVRVVGRWDPARINDEIALRLDSLATRQLSEALAAGKTPERWESHTFALVPQVPASS